MPELPSVTLALPIAIDGDGSLLSTIVPTPWAVAMVALTGLVRLTLNVSLFSSSRSPSTLTVMVRVVAPGAKLSVPEAAV